MAKTRVLGSALADSTPNVIFVGKCKVNTITIWPHKQQVSEVYLQIFDGSGTTPGVTSPNMVIPVQNVTKQGAGKLQATDNTAYGTPKRQKVVIAGGFYVTTGVEMACTTTPTGATAATTTSLPGAFEIDFTPMA